MKTIIIIGCGARECAVLMKCLNCKSASSFRFVTIGTYLNPFMNKNSDFIKVPRMSFVTITSLPIFIQNTQNIEFVFVGGEQLIVDGIADYLEAININCVVPNKEYALIESSKIYTRKLLTNNYLSKYNPKFEIIEKDDIVSLESELKKSYKKVIKKDGLCGGKGVYVEDDHFTDPSSIIEDIKEYIKNSSILVEEKLEGKEFTLMSLVDINGNIQHLSPIFDYKRAEDGDKGPNTGSMGAVLLDESTLHKHIPKQFINEAGELNRKVIDIINKNGSGNGYKGIIYGSYMFCNESYIKLIEFNCRLGDPEGVMALYGLNDSLIAVFQSVLDGTLTKPFKKVIDKCILGVYCVAKEYPYISSSKIDRYDIYFKGKIGKIHNNILNKKSSCVKDKLSIVYGNCKIDKDHIYSGQSRCVLLVGMATHLGSTRKMVYNRIDDVVGNLRYRTDIGAQFLSKYEGAGVSIDQANTLVGGIKDLVVSTYNDSVLGAHGDFGGTFNMKGSHIVSSIDGVGSKTQFIDRYYKPGDYYFLGEDLVNHSINDILVMGATPLFFLDYYGCNNIDPVKFNSFIKGVTNSLQYNSCGTIPLVGGETAEIPSVYNDESTDLVGCMIGKKTDIVSFPREPKSGDVILGFDSNGPHTNGFSLINKYDWKSFFRSDQTTQYHIFIDTLRSVHVNYLPCIQYFVSLYGSDSIIRMCHITGGGLIENLKRVTPNNPIILDYDTLDMIYPAWCQIIETFTKTSRNEMYRVFNCGIGFTLVLSPEIANMVLREKKVKLVKIGYLK